MKRILATGLGLAIVGGSLTSWVLWQGRASIVVGAKNFAENRILAEMFARLIEGRTGRRVERKLTLAGTQICFEALRRGDIDLYPEYTGTGLVEILKERPQGDTAEARAHYTHERVRRVFAERWGLRWLSPLGFENSYELAVPRALARKHDLRTISDLTRIASELHGAFGFEFVERDDGLPGLEKRYGLRFGQVSKMQQALKYQAIAAGHVDCIDVYTTQGRLVLAELVVLDDDRNFFPPYEAAVLLRGDFEQEDPETGEVIRGLEELAGLVSAERMRRWNLRVEVENESVERVAQSALQELGLVADTSQGETAAGLWSYMWAERSTLLRRTLEHLGLTGLGVALGAFVAIPLGLLLERWRALAEPVIRIVGITQTIPSLALLAFLLPWLGLGPRPAIAALWVYALFPILKNTYVGVRDAEPHAVAAATALGMTAGQVLLRVRLPLAGAVIMAGVRTAAVIAVGTATLGAFIGAGGLGDPIISGIQLYNDTMVLAGALPAAALALAVDGVLALVESALKPRALRGRRAAKSK